ncbi:winged helix-turn-helix domain-containing protein [Nanoarchaeota archaeon]
MTARRTKLDIITDILFVIQNKGGTIKPTHLLYKANLSHKLMNTYLEELIKKEAIERVSIKNRSYISIKDKGLELLQSLKKMKEFQDAFGL